MTCPKVSRPPGWTCSNDTNDNGIQDVAEVGAANVTVDLLDSIGTVLRSAQTGNDGLYLFVGRIPADYKIAVHEPAGFVFSARDAALGGAPSNSAHDVDSDVDPLGISPLLTMVAGKQDISVDAGLSPAPWWAEESGSTLTVTASRADQETGLAGISVTLRNSDGGTVLATTSAMTQAKE